MSYRKIHAMFLAVAATLMVAPTALAQQEPIPDDMDVPQLVGQSIQLMKQGNWSRALAFCDKVIEKGGPEPMGLYGPVFGEVWYRKGRCQLNLKQYDEAIKSFEKCYKDFPNKNDAISENSLDKMSLFYWAKAEMGREEWQKALDLFEKFLKEHNRNRDKFSPGDFFISRATCYYNLRKITPGNVDFETALKNKLNYRVPDAAVLNCFRYLVDAAIETKNEQALLDFIAKNRGEIITDADDMYPFSGILIKSAGIALDKGMTRAAMALFQLVPSTDNALDLVQLKLNSLGGFPVLRSPVTGATLIKKQLEQQAAKLEQDMRSDHSPEMYQLVSTAIIHAREGNVRGAYAAYWELERHYSKAEQRESNLFNLARISFMIDRGANGLRDAKLFLAEFPKSEYAPLIKRLMFASLFAEGRYEECIESASEMIGLLQEGTPDHDQCLHVLGGSYFYTGQYEKAQPLLEQHVKLYPDSDSKVAAAYFFAANPFRMREYVKAAKLLDEFLTKYPKIGDNPFLPFALFDRATCHYMVDEYEQSIQLNTRIIKDHGDTQVVDQAHNLRGNSHVGLEQAAEAERDYKQALELADKWGHEVVAGEAIYFLVQLIVSEVDNGGDEENLKKAVPYIDRFWKKYADGSPYRRQVAVLQLPVLETVGRIEEAMQQLRVVIAELAQDAEASGLERVLPTYTEAYLKSHSPEELRDHFARFPNIPLDARAARALLRIEVIKCFEDVAKKAQKPEDKMKAQATINTLFAELKNDFDVKQLTTSILIKVGDYLRTKTAVPREALSFYNEVIEREDPERLLDARFGRADVYGRSPGPQDKQKALDDLKQIITQLEQQQAEAVKDGGKLAKDEMRLLELAMFRSVELKIEKKEWEGAADLAKRFLDPDVGFPRSKMRAPMALYYLGRSYEERNMTGDAIGTYHNVWGTYLGTIKASAPAAKSWMEMLWERNQAGGEGQLGDRQGAYEGGKDYIKATKPITDRMSADDLELWQQVEALVKQYAANPNITP